jgi:hypothetical protein
VARKDKNRPLKIHQRRDLAAAIELLRALLQMGFEMGEPILNFPPLTPPDPDGSEPPLHPVDLSFVEPQDVLLQTTRPPLNDLLEGPRKRVERGFTDVEAWLFRLWEQYFAHCTRSEIQLLKRLHGLLRGADRDCRGMRFKEASGAPYHRLNDCVGSGWHAPGQREMRTAAFLLHVEEAWEGGPGLIGAFGLDGTSSLIWAYRLGHDLADLLREPGFVIAEMVIKKVPERPTDLRWASDLKVEILCHQQA